MVLAEHRGGDLQDEEQGDEGGDEGFHLAEHGLDPLGGQVNAQAAVQVVDGDLEEDACGVDEALGDAAQDVADLADCTTIGMPRAISALREAGVGTMPGTGVKVLDDDIRREAVLL